MATITVGTTASTSLTGLAFQPTMSEADKATIALNIKDDVNAAHPVIPGSFIKEGLLYIPNRGVLKMIPGDIVALDTHSGFPILLPAFAFSVAGSLWNHS